MPSLREQAGEAIAGVLLEKLPDYRGDADLVEVARLATSAAFATMAGQRPCVTCGKGIGPAKVARGYVQCYGCAKGNPLPITVTFTEADPPAAGD